MKSRLLSFLMMSVTILTIASSSAESGITQAPVACDVIGTVERLQQVQLSPWHDGTPSRLGTIETHIVLRVDERKPHKAKDVADTPCQKKAAEKRTYKVCSPTQVRDGDRVHGTEASQTGSARAVSCIFDLVVLPSQ